MKTMTISDLVFINFGNYYKNFCTGQTVKNKKKLPKGAIIVKSQAEAERIYALNTR